MITCPASPPWIDKVYISPWSDFVRSRVYWYRHQAWPILLSYCIENKAERDRSQRAPNMTNWRWIPKPISGNCVSNRGTIERGNSHSLAFFGATAVCFDVRQWLGANWSHCEYLFCADDLCSDGGRSSREKGVGEWSADALPDWLARGGFKGHVVGWSLMTADGIDYIGRGPSLLLTVSWMSCKLHMILIAGHPSHCSDRCVSEGHADSHVIKADTPNLSCINMASPVQGNNCLRTLTCLRCLR